MSVLKKPYFTSLKGRNGLRKVSSSTSERIDPAMFPLHRPAGRKRPFLLEGFPFCGEPLDEIRSPLNDSRVLYVLIL